MITEQKAVALMDEANPVPDLDSYSAADVGVAAYLANLEQRSNEMTQLDTKQKEKTKEKRSATPWLAAAVTVVILGVAIFVLNRGNDDQVASTDIAVIASLMEAWNTQDGEAIASHFTADGVFDVTKETEAIEVWIGREVIGQKTAAYSHSYEWDPSLDFTDIDGVIVFNRMIHQSAPTPSGTIGRPQGVAAVISDGQIESLVVESPDLYFCIGETTTRCKVRETGELRLGE